MALILALDLGSTQIKISFLNENGMMISSAVEGYNTYAPLPSYLEQNPSDWLDALKRGLSKAMENINPNDISCIGFSGHMSGTLLLDRDGNAIGRCILLSDSRSDEECSIIDAAAGKRIREITGNPVINAFTLPKLLWLKRHEGELWDRVRWILSPKDYLRYILSGVISTEYTDAFNTLALDGKKKVWDEGIIRSLGLDVSLFPDVLSPFDIVGKTGGMAKEMFGLPEGIPVVSGASDMAAAAVGMNLFDNGSSALTLGTCATFLSIVPEIMDKGFGQITYHVHAISDSYYALGSHFNGGGAVNWITKLLSESEKLDYSFMDKLAAEAEKVPAGSYGVMTIPFLAGSGSPYFSSSDRLCVYGGSSASDKAVLFKSMLEGITLNLFQTLQLYDGMYGSQIPEIKLAGGGVKIAGWPKIIADVFQRKIHVIRNSDASTIGAALIAGKAAGVFPDIRKMSESLIDVREIIVPDEAAAQVYRDLYSRFIKLYTFTKEL